MGRLIDIQRRISKCLHPQEQQRKKKKERKEIEENLMLLQSKIVHSKAIEKEWH